MKLYYFYGGIRIGSIAAKKTTARLTKKNHHGKILAGTSLRWYSSNSIREDRLGQSPSKTINYGPLLAKSPHNARPTIKINWFHVPQHTNSVQTTRMPSKIIDGIKSMSNETNQPLANGLFHSANNSSQAFSQGSRGRNGVANGSGRKKKTKVTTNTKKNATTKTPFMIKDGFQMVGQGGRGVRPGRASGRGGGRGRGGAAKGRGSAGRSEKAMA